MSPYACDYGAGGAALFDIVNVQIWTRRRLPARSSTLASAPGAAPRPFVIPVLVTGIHLAAGSGACGWLDTGDEPRYDNDIRQLTQTTDCWLSSSGRALAS